MNPVRRSPQWSSIEPLEARIAPARVILVGAPDAPNKADTDYADAAANDGGPGFVATTTVGDPIAAAVDPTNTQTRHFYLKLSKGDVLELYTGQDASEPLLSVQSGNVVAFFNDANNDGEVQQAELVSLALGKDVALTLKSGVAGDIVTNLSENGTPDLADDTLNMTDLVSAKQGIKGLLIGGGAVTGKVLSGGNISNVTVNGGIQSILVGAAAFNQTFDFFPGAGNGGDGILTGIGGIQPGAGQDGGSISNVTLNDDLIDRIEAGAGGFGAKGGNVSNISLTNDTTGFIIKAGDGGAGGGGKINGGLGGFVRDVFIAGRSENPLAPTPNNLMSILAGAGGTSGAGLLGKGGKGGAVSKVYVGFELAGKTIIPSSATSVDNLLIQSGAGGAGRSGGDGGEIKTIRTVVSTANVAGDEIRVIAGAGGDSNVADGAKNGGGGSISDLDLRNLAYTQGAGAPGLDATVIVQAGNAGTAAAAKSGGRGGSITTATLLGSDIRVLAGDGSAAKVGSDGGTIRNVTVQEGDNVLAHNGSFQAGRGGAGAGGNGGRGGDLNNIRIINGDFSALAFNPNNGGQGGDGVGGKGGRGGLVTAISVIEFDSANNAFSGAFSVRSGAGGAGTRGGGDGGAITSITFAGEDLNSSIVSGAGGSTLAGGKGKGGAGGLISRVEVAALGTFGLADVDAIITAGKGGDGAGTSATGGKGADISSVGVRTTGSAVLTAGSGGNGAGAAGGRGGNLLTVGAFAENGSGLFQAGNGGAVGTKAADGGSILGGGADRLSGLYAATTVTVLAGNGTNGGAGGAIKLFGYGSTAVGLQPTPSGNILVQAGNGSALGKSAGRGGSIENVSGSVTSTPGLQTKVAAGVGGGGADKAADGGSITNLALFLGGAAGTEVLIQAGDAGNGGANVKSGAKGGNVTGIQIGQLDPATIVRHISAGDGGDAANKGGLGGTIRDISVLGLDIGVRSGVVYGYTTMGGLFAGAGGDAGVGPAGKGLAGSVTNVVARGIAAIVAGKGATPEEANVVDFIYVGTPTDLLRASEGDLNFADGGDAGWHSFTAAYATASLVGAVSNPNAVDANKFTFVDTNANNAYDLGEALTDGLIVAKVFKQENTNFTPEARLIGGVFYDYNNLV